MRRAVASAPALLAAAIGAGIGASASAQPFDAVITTEVTTQGGTSFGEFVAVTPGAVVDVRVTVRFNTGMALASSVFNIIGTKHGLLPANLTITSPRRIAPFTFGTQTITSYQSAGGFRIDDSRDAGDSSALGLNCNQRPPGIASPANTSNPAEVFRFSVTMPNQAGFLHVRTPWNQIRNGIITTYINPLDPATTTLSNLAVDGAWIYVGSNPCLGQQVTTPPSQRVRVGHTVTIPTSGDGPTWQWFKNNVELLDSARISGAESATLTLTDIQPSDAGDYTMFTLCSHTGVVTLSVFCAADFNGDTFIDFFDYDDFVRCFETGECGDDPLASADINGDGFVDFFDYDEFITSFEEGSC